MVTDYSNENKNEAADFIGGCMSVGSCALSKGSLILSHKKALVDFLTFASCIKQLLPNIFPAHLISPRHSSSLLLHARHEEGCLSSAPRMSVQFILHHTSFLRVNFRANDVTNTVLEKTIRSFILICRVMARRKSPIKFVAQKPQKWMYLLHSPCQCGLCFLTHQESSEMMVRKWARHHASQPESFQAITR